MSEMSEREDRVKQRLCLDPVPIMMLHKFYCLLSCTTLHDNLLYSFQCPCKPSSHLAKLKVVAVAVAVTVATAAAALRLGGHGGGAVVAT